MTATTLLAAWPAEPAWALVVAGLVLLHGLAAAVAVAVMVPQRRAPSAALAWLIAIVGLPVVGVALFASFGSRKWRRVSEAGPTAWTPRTPVPIDDATPTDRLLRAANVPAASTTNALRLLETGVEAFEALRDLIDSATASIDIAMYIWRPDSVGAVLIEHVARRAQAGVAIRVLLDAWGSFPATHRRFRGLVQAGVSFRAAPRLLHAPGEVPAQLRNHRKMVVIDGALKCFAGGMNLGAEYLGPTEDPARWIDLAFILRGPAVAGYAQAFASDWAAARGPGRQAEPLAATAPTATDSALSVVPGGPDTEGDPLYDAVLTAIFRARTHVVIVTPYFIPDEALLHALVIAARTGVEVCVVVPARGNHVLANLAGADALRELSAVGARIRLSASMVHAKAMIIDDSVAVLGSVNFDVRSFLLNFELSIVVHDRPTVQRVAAWADRLAKDCSDGPAPAGLRRRVAEGAVRLLSPLL